MNVLSIFDSIDGEVNGFNGPGQASTFIRLAGCNLRCSYCDTSYSWDPRVGEHMTIEKVLAGVRQAHVTITGGEPLLQQEKVASLCHRLVEAGRSVSIETNGTVAPRTTLFPPALWVRFVMDFKSISSGRPDWYFDKFVTASKTLRSEDVVKFVLGTQEDLAETIGLVQAMWGGFGPLGPKRAYGTIFGGPLSVDALVQWILEHDPFGQLNLQLHKLIWPNTAEGVER